MKRRSRHETSRGLNFMLTRLTASSQRPLSCLPCFCCWGSLRANVQPVSRHMPFPHGPPTRSRDTHKSSHAHMPQPHGDLSLRTQGVIRSVIYNFNCSRDRAPCGRISHQQIYRSTDQQISRQRHSTASVFRRLRQRGSLTSRIVNTGADAGHAAQVIGQMRMLRRCTG